METPVPWVSMDQVAGNGFTRTSVSREGGLVVDQRVLVSELGSSQKLVLYATRL